MTCPSCGHATSEVIGSQHAMVQGVPSVRRRRKCPACQTRWTTHEVPMAPSLQLKLMVLKRDLADIAERCTAAVKTIEGLTDGSTRSQELVAIDDHQGGA